MQTQACLNVQVCVCARVGGVNAGGVVGVGGTQRRNRILVERGVTRSSRQANSCDHHMRLATC